MKMNLKDFKGKPGVFLQEGHEYISRRQLFGAGVIPFAAGMLMPTLWDIFVRNNFAQAQVYPPGCNAISSGPSPFPAILHLNLSGGPLACQYAIPAGPDNTTLLTNLGNVGLGTSTSTYNQVPLFSNRLMVPTANGSSADPTLGAFYNAVTNGMSAATQAKVTAVATSLDAGNDTSGDAENPAALIAAWAKGTKLPPLISQGIGQQSALLTPPSPIQVSSVTSVGNQLAPATGALNATLTQTQKEAVFNLAASLSGSQAATLGSMPNGANMTNLLNCAGVQNVTLTQQGGASFDPRQVASLQTIYGINASSSANSSAVIEATIVNCALQGLTPLGQFNLGGGDYHGNARANTDPFDANAGAIIGRAIQAAAALGKQIYIMTTQDGGMQCSSQTAAGAQGAGDDSGKCVMHLITYNPTAAAPATRNWINGFSTGQSTNTVGSTGFIASDSMSTRAVVANIIHNFTGSTAAFTALDPSFTAAQLASILVI